MSDDLTPEELAIVERLERRIYIDGAATKIALGRKAEWGTLDVEPERFPPDVQRYIYDYGLRQVLNDAMAEKAVKDDKGKVLKDERGNIVMLPRDVIVAKAFKRLDALYAGNLRTRTDAEPLAPVEHELTLLVRAALHKTYQGIGVYNRVPKGTKNRVLAACNLRRADRGHEPLPDDAAMVAMYMATQPNAAKLREIAERRVAESIAAAADTVDGM